MRRRRLAARLEGTAGTGIRVGKDRVEKLMQRHGIRARGNRRFKVTTYSCHDLPISPNALNREFTVSEPDKGWVGDITYIATDEGWLFLPVVMRLHGQRFKTRREVKDEIIDCLLCYTCARLHSTALDTGLRQPDAV